MSFKPLNNVGYSITTTGTSDITIPGTALTTYQTIAEADSGFTDGDTFGYRLEENDNWEIGILELDDTLTTGIRTVLASSNAGSEINLLGASRLTSVVLAEDIRDLISKVEQVQPVCIAFSFDNGAAPLTTSFFDDFVVPFDMDILEWTLILGSSDTVSIDLWQDTYADYPPTNTDSITNGNNPATSAANKAQSSSLGGWSTVRLDQGSVLRAAIEAVTTATKATLILRCERVLT